jgi:hypothetical protein
MKTTAAFLLRCLAGATGLVAACGGDGGVPEELDPRLALMLDAHNQVRAGASPSPSPALPSMTWAGDLAAAAQRYAARCDFSHDPDRGPVGENLSVNAPPGWRMGENVVIGWAEEAADYDYATDTCAAVCGHYTQIVWRDSVELGCGVATCNGGIDGFTGDAGEIWVCRYRAPGNFGGRRPY